MKIPYFVIDAFTGDAFKGNPAGGRAAQSA